MKKHLLLLTTCIALFVTQIAVAQKFYRGELIFADGKVMEGYVKFPSGYRISKVHYKPTETGEKISFKSSDVASMIVYGAESRYQLDWGTSLNRAMFNRYKKSKPQWMLVITAGYATLYTVAEKKIKLKNDKISFKNSGAIPYYAKRDGEESASSIGFYLPAMAGIEANFRGEAAKYFSDNASLVKRIEAGESSLGDIVALVEEYNTWAQVNVVQK